MKERKKAKRGIEYLRLNMVGGLRQRDESSLNQRLHFSFPLSPLLFQRIDSLSSPLPLLSILSIVPSLGLSDSRECCCFFNISFFSAVSLSSAFLYQCLHLITSLSLIFCLHSCVDESCVPKLHPTLLSVSPFT